MRNIDKTKEKILKAAQDIMFEGGFSALKVNALAHRAGVGKPLIYRYFTNMDGVGKALAQRVWRPSMKVNNSNPEFASSEEVLKDLVEHGRLLGGDRSLRDMLVWSLASKKSPKLLESLAGSPQFQSEVNRALIGKEDRVAIYALLKAAIAFLVLYRDHNKNWKGLGIKSPKEMVRFEYAMADIVKKYWP